MAERELQTFSVRIDEGPEQTITVATGIYHYAAAAVPALLDCAPPIIVEIWAPELLPQYGPYYYKITTDEYGAVVVQHAVKVGAERGTHG